MTTTGSEEGDNRVGADRVAFARSVSIRRLSSATDTRQGSLHRPSLLPDGNSTPQLTALSLLRRPATAAATTHSRVHQALRENNNNFVFSSKQTTVEGLFYSSRFPMKYIVNRTAPAAVLQFETKDAYFKAKRIERKVPSKEVTGSTPRMDVETKKREMRRQLSSGCGRAWSAAPASMSGFSSDAKVATLAGPDESGIVLRQRRCAKTFEDMIAAQVKPPESTGDTKVSARITVDPVRFESRKSPRTDHGIINLVEHGIIESVLELSTSSDAATQGHCCRALYHLSCIDAARKSMIAHGVVASLKQLSRTTSPVSRLDMAAMLCHLSVQDNVVDALFFEGIDRTLLRLIISSSWETKRICAATVFNLSADARHIRHFQDAFSQLLIAATKFKSGTESSWFLNQDATTELNSPAAFLIKAIYNASLVSTFHSALLGENIPRFLASQTPLTPPAIQVWALRSFVSLCEVQTNRQLLVTSFLCKLLASALHSCHEEIQETALFVLLQLSTDEGSHVKIWNWISISLLIRITKQHIQSWGRATRPVLTEKRGNCNIDQLESKRDDNYVVYLHSCILRIYCKSVQMHHELIQEGVISVLLIMSRMRELNVKINAISSLCYLILSFTEEVAVYIPELTDNLLALAQSPRPQDRLFAVEMLYNISCCDGCAPLLCKSEPLLNWLVHFVNNPFDNKTAEFVAVVIYRLAGTMVCASQLLRRGIFSQMVSLIRQYPTCRTYALSALLLFAKHGGDEFPHGGDEITQLVLALLSNGNELKMAATMWMQPALPARLVKRKPNVDTFHGGPCTIRSAVTLLAHLAHHPKNQAALVCNGSVFRFLKNLHQRTSNFKQETTEQERMEQDNNDDIILTNCAYIYYCLTATHEGCELLVKERGIEDLIKLSHLKTTRIEIEAEGDTYTMKELCMLALCRLSSFAGIETRLIEQGAVEAVMVMALVTTDSVTIKALCIMTLANCLVDATPHCLQSLIGHGIIWALSSLCTVEYPEVSYVCAVSLCNLSAHYSKVLKFLDAGTPKALIYLLTHSGGADAAEDAAILLVTVKTIANLVTNDKLCQAFLNEGLEMHLSKHFSSSGSSDELRQLAAMVLFRVTSANDAEISPERINSTMLLWMEQIIDMKDESLIYSCMLTVHDLTRSLSLNVAKIDVPHVLKLLIQVLQRHHFHNAHIVTLCLSVLYNLSCRMEAILSIVQSKIMPFLRQQVPWSKATLVAQRRKSTVHFANSLSLPALSTLAGSTSSATAQLCCLVLYNLSCYYAPDDDKGVLAALVSCHAVATLHDIYFGPFEEQKEIAAVAICNIAVGKVNTARVVEDFAGRVLIHFVCSERFSPSQYRLVTAALRKLSNAPGNQVCLLTSHIANAMVLILEIPNMDINASLNILAALRLLSSCKDHVSRLLTDGVLPCIVKLAEQPSTTAGMSSYCFEIISNLCSIDFQEFLKNCPEINVVGTLTKLSDQNILTNHGQYLKQHAPEEHATSIDSYCARGKDCSLSLPAFIKNLMKDTSTTRAIQNSLQVNAKYTVHARKWSPHVQLKPRKLAMLVCKAISPTDNGHVVSPEIKQRIGYFSSLPKEALVRKDKNVATQINCL